MNIINTKDLALRFKSNLIIKLLKDELNFRKIKKDYAIDGTGLLTSGDIKPKGLLDYFTNFG